MDSDTEIFFKNGKLDYLNVNNFDIGDVNISHLKNLNAFIINNSDGSNFNLSNEKSLITTRKLGVNNPNPKKTLDINGDLKLVGSIYGNKDKEILKQNNDLNFNPNSDFQNINIKKNLKVIDGGLTIGSSNKTVGNGELVIEKGIYDSEKNMVMNLDGDNMIFNPNKEKILKMKGRVLFDDVNNGVSIGNNDDIPNHGELYVSRRIKTSMVDIGEEGNRQIMFSGNKPSNIHLGDYTTISNTDQENNNTSLFGNNLYVDDNEVKVKNDDDNGYRGIKMNNLHGIQFYSSKESVNRGDMLNSSNITISNNGQLIISTPILELDSEEEDFDSNDPQNKVYNYIREQLGSQPIGSHITFTIRPYLEKDKIINCIKIGNYKARLYVINRKTNKTEKDYDIEF